VVRPLLAAAPPLQHSRAVRARDADRTGRRSFPLRADLRGLAAVRLVRGAAARAEYAGRRRVGGDLRAALRRDRGAPGAGNQSDAERPRLLASAQPALPLPPPRDLDRRPPTPL